jgi:serine protease
MSRVVAAAAVVLVMGCGRQEADVDSGGNEVSAQSAPLGWSEFLSRIHQLPDQDLFIVNGDTTVEGWKNLRAFYEVAVLGNSKLIIDTNGGVDSKWTDAQKLNLSYCVSTAFGSRHAAVVTAMADSAAAWSAATAVKFVYTSAQDGNCNTANNSVLFDVRPVNVNGQYIARSFFPGDSRSARSVEIDNSAFTSSGNPTLTGVLRHELGHTLGFRHEHTRPEAGACFEDNSWRVLTTYDSASVMHYPQCNGTGDWSLVLTARDVAGAKLVYGEPTGGNPTPTPPPPSGTAKTQTFSGSAATGQWVALAPFSVKGGTTFSVVLSGTGDPDLYVRVGSAPTATRFTCRPYLDGPNETCSVTIPSNSSKAYVAINGYAAATYSATVSWTAP